MLLLIQELISFVCLVSSQISGDVTKKPETYSVYFVDTTPQKKGLKVGDSFFYYGESFKILEIKEDGEMILVKPQGDKDE